MKKLLFLGLALVLCIACDQKEPVRWTKTSPEVDVAKALVKDYQEGNWDSWLSHYSDTAKVYHNSINHITTEQLRDNFKNTLTNYSSYGFSDEDIFYEMIIDDDGDKWVYFWGTWEGNLAESNKKIVLPVHLALKFVDNRIVLEYAYYDTSPIIEALKEIDAAKMDSQESEDN